MLPRRTQNRPIMPLGSNGSHIYLNNIDSPGVVRPLLSCIISPEDKNKNIPLWADHLSCFAMPWKSVKKHGRISFDMTCFLVEFWDERRKTPGSVVAVEVYCPLHWTANFLLSIILESFERNQVISIINTYQLNGMDLPFNTINTIHRLFEK